MLGVILGGAVLGAATLILLGGGGPQPRPVRVEIKDRKKNAEDR